ncbi:5662_t:CDS:10 [Ambispora gerdemannii]|uniref:5662_t:CDS:1 n=1 Tax=Ambispora gerdemannii TaxID=144530 RepID=A0A9N8VDE5_9GLOM|nr:5662_t:CDS:10 [Ambispora gerdemannii]
MVEYTFETLNVTRLDDYLLHVELNRPKKLNALNETVWQELKACFTQVKHDSEVRAVVISGAGKIFTAGIDLFEIPLVGLNTSETDPARSSHMTRLNILRLQDSFNSIEQCDKPVIAIVHSHCVGGGVDMITACDIRYCSKDATFSVKEVDLGLAADVGTLQRLPKVIGNDSFVREVCLTGRNFSSEEALTFGLVNKILPTKEDAFAEGLKTAKIIASKSPVAVLGTKHLLNYSREHSTSEGLNYTAVWNSAMLNTKDIGEATKGFFEKKQPKFSKL